MVIISCGNKRKFHFFTLLPTLLKLNLLGGMQTSIATLEISMEFPQKIKSGTFDPAISLLGIYLKKPKTLIRKNICTKE